MVRAYEVDSKRTSDIYIDPVVELFLYKYALTFCRDRRPWDIKVRLRRNCSADQKERCGANHVVYRSVSHKLTLKKRTGVKRKSVTSTVSIIMSARALVTHTHTGTQPPAAKAF
jgi:hypothetical protein